MTAKERVRAALAGKPTDRLPVLVPGGMMCAATQELLALAGLTWEAVNREPQAMASFALTIQGALGLDNVGVPFCMTVEAEALCSEVALGSPLRPPRIEREAHADLPTDELSARDGRQQVCVKALRILAQEAPDVAVVGNVAGPVSVAAMVVEPGRFWRALRRQPEAADDFLERVTDFLTAFAEEQVGAGADVVVVSEPSGTGQILGPVDFGRFVLPHLNRICLAVRKRGAKAVVHICGQLRAIAAPLALLEADALSVDAVADIGSLRQAGCRLPLMGNLSTFLLQDGPVEDIRRAVDTVREQGFVIVAPACGVSGATPLGHLRALVEAARVAGPTSTSSADVPERR